MRTTHEMLQNAPGLTRELLYSWCDRGYLNPTQSPIGASSGYRRKLFSEDDYRKARLMRKYYQQGLSPRQANVRADEFLQTPFVLELDVTKTFATGATSEQLHVSAMQPFEVAATIEAYRIRQCEVSVLFDAQYLTLEIGKPHRLIQPEVYDEVNVYWTFRLFQIPEVQTNIHITAQSDEATRTASVAVVGKWHGSK
jgi:hypothetical protein